VLIGIFAWACLTSNHPSAPAPTPTVPPNGAPSWATPDDVRYLALVYQHNPVIIPGPEVGANLIATGHWVCVEWSREDFSAIERDVIQKHTMTTDGADGLIRAATTVYCP